MEMGYKSGLFFFSFFLKSWVLSIYHHTTEARLSVIFKHPQVIPICSKALEPVLFFAYTVLSVVLENLVSPANLGMAV